MTFDRICHEIMELHERKNKDYGNAADASFKEFGIVSYVIRLNDKLNRLKSLTKPGATMEVKDESIIDTLKDLAAYSIMAIESLMNV
jgi:arginine utilization protein RocB